MAAIATQTAITRIIMVASALISGRRPSLMREKIKIGRVFAPGPVTKLAMTRSSRDNVKASNQPEIKAGVSCGMVMAVKTLNGFALRT